VACSEVPKRIVLDIDDTFDRVHGGQQLRLFNAYHDDYGFQLIVAHQLVERIDHDLLFRWFVGLGIEDAVWDARTFNKNREPAARRRYRRAVDLPPEKWTPGYAYFASACCGVM
jgi:hypothetical protein